MKYGIFLAYGPRVRLRTEGLGRQLAEFVRAAAEMPDTQIVIAAPSWLRRPLRDLLDAFSIDPETVQVVGPSNPPWVWRVYSASGWLASFRRSRKWKIKSRRSTLRQLMRSIYRGSVRLLFSPRDMVSTALAVMAALILFVLFTPVLLILLILYAVAKRASHGGSKLRRGFRRGFVRAVNLLRRIDRHIDRRIFAALTSSEAAAVAEYANRESDVTTWFSPTAFWPEFNSIKGPKVMCVPDVLLYDFPVGFAKAGGAQDGLVSAIVEAVDGGQSFITYSEEVKWSTLVDRFGVRPSSVQVVHHGTNDLSDLISATGFPDNVDAVRTLCGQQLLGALAKCVNNPDATRYASPDLAFLFFASQFRPNKNILTLLKAFTYLRRVRGMPLKLILTGRPEPEVQDYLRRENLNDDVLCLSGLTEKELASCYYLARIAISPSLMEGGMPFTFSEALSVGTPALLADIAVSREILTDDRVRDVTLFDPYSWMNLAEHCARILQNEAETLSVQLEFYERTLRSRTWKVAALDYFKVFEAASQRATL